MCALNLFNAELSIRAKHFIATITLTNDTSN